MDNGKKDSKPITDYSRFINQLSAARKPSQIRVIHSIFLSGAECISLAGGVPNPELFPFKNMEITLRDGSNITLEGDDLNEALQYSGMKGNSALLNWLRQFQNYLHNPKVDYDMTVTNGAMEGICRVFEMMTERGDPILIEKPTYPGVLSSLKPYDLDFLEIDTDEFGLIPKSLETTLIQYYNKCKSNVNIKMPKYLYTIPNGCNPSGSCTTLERKQRIYQLCREYDIIILEDDPYYFLQFKEPTESYFSMDEDGRVIRFDSFSKTVSAGLRVGVTSGPPKLIERIFLHNSVGSMHCSSLSQMILTKLFDTWKLKGFLEHTKKIAIFYNQQKNIIMDLLDKHLKGLAEWKEPTAGMFIWVKLINISNTEPLSRKAISKKVLFIPGCAFMPDATADSSYIRLSFSLATQTEIDTALERLAELIKEEQKLT